nr:hypothetical protein [Tanacetum cinerariifolium]
MMLHLQPYHQAMLLISIQRRIPWRTSLKVIEAFETDKSAPTLPRSPRLHRAGISAPQGYRAAMIRLKAASPLPLPAPSPPLLVPCTTHRDDLPKADMPLQKRAHFTAPTGRSQAMKAQIRALQRDVDVL